MPWLERIMFQPLAKSHLELRRAQHVRAGHPTGMQVVQAKW